MAQLQQPFDVRSVQPRGDFEVIPEGWYPARMISSDAKPAKSGEGGYIECIYEIIDGPHKGRNMWDRLNLWNNNPKTVEIAYGTLSAIGWCTGVFTLQDTSQLHNIPLMIKVVQRKNEQSGGMANDVKGYKTLDGKEPWKAESQPQQAPQGSYGQPPQQQPQGTGGWQQGGPPQQSNGGGQEPPQQPQQGGAPWTPPQGGGAPQQPPQQPPQGGSGWQQGQPGPAPWGGQQ